MRHSLPTLCQRTEFRKLPSREVSCRIASVFCRLDTGCEASILLEQLYKELKENGVESLELPTQNVVLVGAFSRNAYTVRKQVFVTLKFGDIHIAQIFLVS
jgi:hypothetical protein